MATQQCSAISPPSSLTVATHGGFLQVFQNAVTLLTDRAELAEGDQETARRLAESMAAQEGDAE